MIKDQIRQESAALFEKVKAYREHMHRFPELSFQEEETMQFVSNTLTTLGIDQKTHIGGTGVVAMIHPLNGPTETCIALRSDLDALPIQEENDLPFKSTKNGIMHACGHDVHTAILLGAAEIIQKHRADLTQSVKLIFQPGEEKNPGGASLMIQDGVLENPSVACAFALHVFPELEVGKVGFRTGMYMASCDEIYITIHGKGGHGATPQNCIDPIVIGSNLILQLQQIISRRANPTIPSVLSFGHFEALGATNVIPSKAILKGTFRTMDEDWRKEALFLIEKMAKEITEGNGANLTLEISKGYPFLINDEEQTLRLKEKATQLLGIEQVVDLPLRMTSEDFAFYSQKVPVCFFRLGVRNEEKGIVYGVHHPKFNIDDQALVTGMNMMAYAVF